MGHGCVCPLSCFWGHVQIFFSPCCTFKRCVIVKDAGKTGIMPLHGQTKLDLLRAALYWKVTKSWLQFCASEKDH